MLTRRRSWKWSLCQPGHLRGTKDFWLLGICMDVSKEGSGHLARSWIDSGFEASNPGASGELLPAHKGPRDPAQLQAHCTPQADLLARAPSALCFVVWFSQVKPEPNPWHTSCSFTPHPNYRGRAAGSPSQDTNHPCRDDPCVRCPSLPVSTPGAVW